MNAESNRIEYKATLTDGLEREVVAFLNYHEGGEIHIGIDDEGNAIGVTDADDIQLKIVDRIKNNILPATMGLFDIVVEKVQGKEIVKIIISSGFEKPYYLRKYGMAPVGCFIRVGSSVQQMTTQMIEDYYVRRVRVTLGNMPSPRSDLSFEQLKIYYEAQKLRLNDQFEKNLDLLSENGRYNYAAYMLSDNNGISIKVAKYAGTTKVKLIENEEYGYCSIIKATKNVLEKLNIENRTFAKITYPTRIEKNLVDKDALREAVINAIVHNDYSREVPPVFEIYSDRLTITSYGGLVAGLSQHDFFNCRSMPRNRELMRVFKDVRLVEHLGSGMSRIMAAYDESIFEFSPNFLVVTFPFADDFTMSLDDTVNDTVNDRVSKNLNATEQKIFVLLQNDGNMTKEMLMSETDVSHSTVSRALKKLRELGYIERIGSDKSGAWHILK
jgi:Predicted transcriptional regulator containing an HTH domain and an uncharacterized domain shared with the mammalian protein Schlafen